MISDSESKVKGEGWCPGEVSAAGPCHPLRPSWLTGARWGEDVGVADAQLEVEEAGGGGDAAVPGVGLLHWVAVLQGVNAHPALIWWRHEQTLWRLREDTEVLFYTNSFKKQELCWKVIVRQLQEVLYAD